MSTIVCNHIGWFDILSLISSPLLPGFVAKSELETIPALSTIIKVLQSLFISREEGAQRDVKVQQIKERQRQIGVDG